jgi:ribosomal protein S18 acetylase RimI-like enzyme
VSDFRIVPFEPGQIRTVVEIHGLAFRGFFLTSMGPGFLKVFYRSFLGEKTAIGFAAVDAANGAVLGGVFGTTAPAGFFRRLALRKWAAFGLAALGAVAKKPGITIRLLHGLSYRGDPPAHPGYALLSSIAVSPEAQGRGVGKALLDAWVEAARRRACPGAYLTTDAVDNDAVNRFYRKNGWTLEDAFVTREGRKMNRYTMVLAAGQQ